MITYQRFIHTADWETNYDTKAEAWDALVAFTDVKFTLDFSGLLEKYRVITVTRSNSEDINVPFDYADYGSLADDTVFRYSDPSASETIFANGKTSLEQSMQTLHDTEKASFLLLEMKVLQEILYEIGDPREVYRKDDGTVIIVNTTYNENIKSYLVA